MKFSIVGMGRVGSAIAFAATMEPIVSELWLLNRSIEKAEGDAMDLTHASVLRNSNMTIQAGTVEDSAGSDVIVFTPSVSPTRADWKRSDLAIGNRGILEEWLPRLAELSPNAVLIMVTNPVDVMTYEAIRLTGFPPARVIGTGTLVDSIRYRSLLSAELKIHADDIRAYILGEHGDDQFAAYSVAMTGGEKFFPSEMTRRLFRETVNLGYEVYNRKGYTNYGIALATMTIVDSIVYDLRHTMPVSVLVDGFLGVSDVCLSLPAVIGREGVTRVLHPPLSEDEADSFRACAEKVRGTIDMMAGVR
ncbi:lactate/malate dehydrogenase family protein [Rhodopirellula sp. SWK7]|uniref:lactate/malate dehydrogenase family protein n=1 Tax=Rhodopirellula sp. SWK7 TaxID=595460 RepID=UPI0002BF15D0|nr:lactate/malate dehydrogenase family protein [Rhodopirellula sp. SWK7]EMI43584.1 L-lactate/malate dehydrogenase [Rhodopirellula sp. SWK7]